MLVEDEEEKSGRLAAFDRKSPPLQTKGGAPAIIENMVKTAVASDEWRERRERITQRRRVR